MGGCSVVGCRNRFTRGKLHFYRFPKDSRRDIWIQFTRKGKEFLPKGSSTICEVHFAKECFVEKKDRVHLSKDAVPTIFFKQTSLGLEMVEVPYDAENHQYFGHESMQLLSGVISVEDEEAITNKRQQKLDELKSLCRFCLSNSKDENKCVALTQLSTYKIDQNDIILSLGLAKNANELLGELVCEHCFQQIVEFDLFKKKCREAQDEVFAEIQELDNKIQEIRNKNSSGKPWFKSEVGVSLDDSQVETSLIEVLEEHLVDEEDEFENANFHYEPNSGEVPLETSSNQEYFEEIHDGYKIIYQHVPDTNESDEKSPVENDISDIMSEETCQPMEIQVMQLPSIKTEGSDEKVGIDEYPVVSTDDIIKNPERNRFCFRVYECFFCKLVSVEIYLICSYD